MRTENYIFIATSLDGFIADQNGSIDWLHQIPNPQGDDMGYKTFMGKVDALLMGRNTYETVLGFDIEWPYEKPVFVLSTTLKTVPKDLEGKVFLRSGDLSALLAEIKKEGYNRLYIDGGKTIQRFLEQDLIDEMIITTIPILLGGGSPLFGANDKRLNYTCINTSRYLDAVAQNHYVRNRK